ncbi:MAG: site-specific DNA-methyltransferase [bacterium]|nr:site-specific DNA-methyltransferase [bacterium]MDE0674444.1 site-specific DNA-methyltransferase [bacterium]
MAKSRKTKSVETLTHDEASRVHIPTAEYQAVLEEEHRTPVQIAYGRRNPDLDPQLVWRGKDVLEWSDLVIQAPPLFIQEKVHPKVLIDDLFRRTRDQAGESDGTDADQPSLFDSFNGLPSEAARTEFYQHDANWSNRMILGDSLQVMASLAEREGLRGKVQCIYIDPPYGIKFNSNWQWSTTSRDVRDGQRTHITREPEQVKAYRDTWRDGIHSYLTYLRDRLTVARDLLTESGSVFVQIGEENVHRVRGLLDEVFGDENFVSLIAYAKTTGFSGKHLSSVCDYVLWYARRISNLKYRSLLDAKVAGEKGASRYKSVSRIKAASNSAFDLRRLATSDQLTSQGASDQSEQTFAFQGNDWNPPSGLHWKTTILGLSRLAKAGRVIQEGRSIRYIRFLDDFAVNPRTNVWLDIGGVQSRTDPKVYVVQTATEAVKRCILMTTDPSDVVLDPTCGSGTTAYVAEQWGRRWITIDTSRVALTLARSRIMGARFPYYLLADSPQGQHKEAEIERTLPSEAPTYSDIRQGLVYRRVPHVTLRAIAYNTEIDIVWDRHQETLEPLREQLNSLSSKTWEEWEVPRDVDLTWPDKAKRLHAEWWEQRVARQREIDASIAANADYEYLYDKPYEDKGKVRVAGPFTVESISPHRTLAVDEHHELIDHAADVKAGFEDRTDFDAMILDHLRTSGVQQAHKEDRIIFSAVRPWPGDYISAEGTYFEGDAESGPKRRAAIFVGPEFGTVSRPDLVGGAREAAEAGFDLLISLAFSYDARSTELAKLGVVPILKARINADLHMADDLKNTGKGNLFVIFGEPDIDILEADDGQVQVKLNGVDVYHPNTGQVRSDNADGIACWFVDTDYNEESFFVRHAYFLGANDPYRALKTTLKAEINPEAWATLNSDTSRPFQKPSSGRIAVKVINHLGDEVMKVFRT